MSSYTRQQLERWLGTIDVDAEKVVDIGGSQLPVRGRTKTWNVEEYTILDLDSPHENKVKPDVVLDINNEVPPDSVLYAWGADVVFCLEVMEYVWSPVQALRNMHSMLEHGGLLYISFPFVYPVHNPKEHDALRYTEYGAEKLLEKSAFKVQDVILRKTWNASLASFYNKEGMRGSRDYANHEAVGSFVVAKKI